MAKSGYFAFQIYTGEGKAEILYDADRKIMTVAVFLLNNKRNLITRFEFNGRDKYEATNAFGAKTLVTRTAVTYYYLDFANYEDLGASRYLDAAASSLGLTYDNLYRDAQPRHSWAKDADKFARDAFVFSMPMDVATARRVKTNLKVLAVVRLVKPYDSQIDRHLAPTFDQPIETVERSYFLNTNLAELWVYDETTGEVFARRKVQSGSTLAPS
jgi:hypothetical protein